MSKSKKNTIDPEKIIDQYGADSVRFFILSDSPPEKMCSGLNKVWLLINLFKNFGYYIKELLKKSKTKKEKMKILILPFTQTN